MEQYRLSRLQFCGARTSVKSEYFVCDVVSPVVCAAAAAAAMDFARWVIWRFGVWRRARDVCIAEIPRDGPVVAGRRE